MVLDPTIPLQAKSFDTLGMLENGSKVAQLWQQQSTDKELGRIYNEAQGDLSKMVELGKQSKMARFVVPQLQAQQSAQYKAAIDQQKSLAEIGKTNSETFKNNQQGGEYGANVGQKKLGAFQQAVMQGAQSGDHSSVLLGLYGAQQAGLITSEDLSTQTQLIKAMTKDELKQYALDVTFANAKDPASISFQTANNAADNATSQANSVRNYNASIYATKTGADTADKNRSQAQNQFNQEFEYKVQQDEIRNGQAEVKEFGGKAYIVYKDGNYRPFIGPDGVQVNSTKPETPIQRMEREDKVLDLVNVAKSAAQSSKLAATLANDLKGLDDAAGGFGLMARVPGSHANAFSNQIETLKSNVFLQQIQQMRGLGALTDAEGARLEKSIASLDLSQSPQVLQQNLTAIAEVMSAGAKTANKRTKIYSNKSQSKPTSSALSFFQ
ncbi:hypothetical protein BEN74_18790 [Acinetobacter sp. WCHAc010034]|uniref:hypothetical protein n=1 Tax=Acinetobacter sp. WCHAc010034 TaxID=1879049 RepID=UPI00083A69CE|nr:hypothetical protein [Acinetobacter sp. WCHAc010034]AYA04629.1 hypothetical protein BEN74_18790 [Acinetobacter sp. WCHAc010034]